MARGDFYVFNEFWTDLGKAVHNLTTGTIKGGIVNATLTPTIADATPRWADYSANEVSGTNYPTGGITFSTSTWTQTAGVYKLDSDDETIAQSGTGFTNGYWLILYNDSATNKEAIGFLDLGGAVGNVAEALDIVIPTNGWFTGQRLVA